MKNPLKKADKSEAIENFLEELSKGLGTQGSSTPRSVAFENSSCVSCPGPATKFRDAVSVKEYSLSGMCQCCQDRIWGVS